MEFKLSSVLTKDDLIEFDLYTKQDETMVETPIVLRNLEASDKLKNFVLRQGEWQGYQYGTIGNEYIGYGTKQKLNDIGMLESDAFNYWIEDFKTKETKLKSILGNVTQLTQSQYDALVSLYYHTGNIYQIGSSIRTFQVKQYIENNQWQYYATALVLSGYQRNIRQGEAKIMMLGDYGRTKDRSIIKAEGIQKIRQLYPNRFINTKAKEQAEYVYYAETKRFLPKMTQSRMRQIVAQYNTNTG